MCDGNDRDWGRLNSGMRILFWTFILAFCIFFLIFIESNLVGTICKQWHPVDSHLPASRSFHLPISTRAEEKTHEETIHDRKHEAERIDPSGAAAVPVDTLIFTQWSFPPVWSDKHVAILSRYAAHIASQHCYAKRHGYDYVMDIRDPLQYRAITLKNGTRRQADVKWNCVHLLNDWLPHYEYVLNTDIDYLVSNYDVSLEHFLLFAYTDHTYEDYEVHATGQPVSDEWDDGIKYASGNDRGCSYAEIMSGLGLTRQSALSEDFVHNWLSMDHCPHYYTEQTALHISASHLLWASTDEQRHRCDSTWIDVCNNSQTLYIMPPKEDSQPDWDVMVCVTKMKKELRALCSSGRMGKMFFSLPHTTECHSGLNYGVHEKEQLSSEIPVRSPILHVNLEWGGTEKAASRLRHGPMFLHVKPNRANFWAMLFDSHTLDRSCLPSGYYSWEPGVARLRAAAPIADRGMVVPMPSQNVLDMVASIDGVTPHFQHEAPSEEEQREGRDALKRASSLLAIDFFEEFEMQRFALPLCGPLRLESNAQCVHTHRREGEADAPDVSLMLPSTRYMRGTVQSSVESTLLSALLGAKNFESMSGSFGYFEAVFDGQTPPLADGLPMPVWPDFLLWHRDARGNEAFEAATRQLYVFAFEHPATRLALLYKIYQEEYDSFNTENEEEMKRRTALNDRYAKYSGWRRITEDQKPFARMFTPREFAALQGDRQCAHMISERLVRPFFADYDAAHCVGAAARIPLLMVGGSRGAWQLSVELLSRIALWSRARETRIEEEVRTMSARLLKVALGATEQKDFLWRETTLFQGREGVTEAVINRTLCENKCYRYILTHEMPKRVAFLRRLYQVAKHNPQVQE